MNFRPPYLLEPPIIWEGRVLRKYFSQFMVEIYVGDLEDIDFLLHYNIKSFSQWKHQKSFGHWKHVISKVNQIENWKNITSILHYCLY